MKENKFRIEVPPREGRVPTAAELLAEVERQLAAEMPKKDRPFRPEDEPVRTFQPPLNVEPASKRDDSVPNSATQDRIGKIFVETSPSIFCAHCGANNSSTAKFCRQCGQSLRDQVGSVEDSPKRSLEVSIEDLAHAVTIDREAEPQSPVAEVDGRDMAALQRALAKEQISKKRKGRFYRLGQSIANSNIANRFLNLGTKDLTVQSVLSGAGEMLTRHKGLRELAMKDEAAGFPQWMCEARKDIRVVYADFLKLKKRWEAFGLSDLLEKQRWQKDMQKFLSSEKMRALISDSSPKRLSGLSSSGYEQEHAFWLGYQQKGQRFEILMLMDGAVDNIPAVRAGMEEIIEGFELILDAQPPRRRTVIKPRLVQS